MFQPSPPTRAEVVVREVELVHTIRFLIQCAAISVDHQDILELAQQEAWFHLVHVDLSFAWLRLAHGLEEYVQE